MRVDTADVKADSARPGDGATRVGAARDGIAGVTNHPLSGTVKRFNISRSIFRPLISMNI